MPDDTHNPNFDSFNRDSKESMLNTPAVLCPDRSSVPTRELALAAANAADDRKASNIVILRVEEVSYLADYFVIATGFSNVQVRAISRSIEDKLAEELQRYPVRVEGLADGNWVLQDYGDLIIHIFQPQEREFYNLEAFWGHAERINFSAYTFGKDSLN